MHLIKILIVIFFILKINSNAIDEITLATKIAQKGFKEFISTPLNSDHFYKNHGLTKKDINGTITLGEPIQLYSISDKVIQSYSDGISFSQLAKKTKIYMFPLLFNGVPKLFLDVSNYGAGQFEIGGLGQSWLCKEYYKIRSIYSNKNDSEIILCQNYNTHYYLFHIPEHSKNNLTIIDPSNKKLKRYYSIMQTSETIKFLRDKMAK